VSGGQHPQRILARWHRVGASAFSASEVVEYDKDIRHQPFDNWRTGRFGRISPYGACIEDMNIAEAGIAMALSSMALSSMAMLMMRMRLGKLSLKPVGVEMMGFHFPSIVDVARILSDLQ
jgi:hypothetical protein